MKHSSQSMPFPSLEDIKGSWYQLGKLLRLLLTSLKWAPVLSHVRELCDTILEDGTPLFWADKDEDGEKKMSGGTSEFVNSDHEDDEDGGGGSSGSEFTLGSEEEEESVKMIGKTMLVSDESGLDSEVYSGSEDEEAEDWETMEKKAAQEDEKKIQEAQRGSSSFRPSKRKGDVEPKMGGRV